MLICFVVDRLSPSPESPEDGERTLRPGYRIAAGALSVVLIAIGGASLADGSLASFLMLACGPQSQEVKPAVTEAQLSHRRDLDGQVIAALKDAGSDLSQAHEIEHHFVCENRALAMRRLGDAHARRGDLTQALSAFRAAQASAEALERRGTGSSGRFQRALAPRTLRQACHLLPATRKVRCQWRPQERFLRPAQGRWSTNR